MATYNTPRKTYYTIASGKLKRYEGEGLVSEFTGIDGFFKGITERSHKINGETKIFTDFNFVDGQDNFCVSCEKFSNNSMTLVRCIANIVDFSKKILIETWQTVGKDGKTHTNVSVKQGGVRVGWVDVPAVESFQIATGEMVKSAKKRDDYIMALMRQINERVHGGIRQEQGAQAAEVDPEPQEDMPVAPGYGPIPPEMFPPYVPNAGE